MTGFIFMQQLDIYLKYNTIEDFNVLYKKWCEGSSVRIPCGKITYDGNTINFHNDNESNLIKYMIGYRTSLSFYNLENIYKKLIRINKIKRINRKAKNE